MSREIVFVAGSPSPTSRSSAVAEAVAKAVEASGFTPRRFGVGGFNAKELLFADASAPTVTAFIEAARGAAAIVLSSPVYKATYAGALKVLVDLIPPDSLVGKPALGIATTKLEAHAAEVNGAFERLFAFFRARASSSLIVLDSELAVDGAGVTLSAAAAVRVDRAAEDLLEALGR
jgi:FMN reductase